MTIATYQAGYPENEAAYFESLDALLRDRISILQLYCAQSVMGRYNKVATAEQRTRFAATFRSGLVETYGRGLIGYENQEIVLVNRAPLKAGSARCPSKQEIRS